jgi:hypothetical protein
MAPKKSSQKDLKEA